MQHKVYDSGVHHTWSCMKWYPSPLIPSVHSLLCIIIKSSGKVTNKRGFYQYLWLSDNFTENNCEYTYVTWKGKSYMRAILMCGVWFEKAYPRPLGCLLLFSFQFHAWTALWIEWEFLCSTQFLGCSLRSPHTGCCLRVSSLCELQRLVAFSFLVVVLSPPLHIFFVWLHGDLP